MAVGAQISRGWLDNTSRPDLPLVLPHPNYPNQHLLVAAAIKRSGKSTVFISLTNQRFEGKDICGLLTEILDQQLGIKVTGLETNLPVEKCVQTVLKGLQP